MSLQGRYDDEVSTCSHEEEARANECSGQRISGRASYPFEQLALLQYGSPHIFSMYKPIWGQQKCVQYHVQREIQRYQASCAYMILEITITGKMMFQLQDM